MNELSKGKYYAHNHTCDYNNNGTTSLESVGFPSLMLVVSDSSAASVSQLPIALIWIHNMKYK